MLMSYDTETTGLRLHNGHKMFAFSVGKLPEDKACIDTLVYREDTDKDFRSVMQKIWMDKNIVKIMHNAKFDMTATKHYLGDDAVLDQPFHDTYLQSHIVFNAHPTHGLKALAWELLGFPKEDEAAVKSFVKSGGDYSMVPPHIMEPYQLADAERTMLLHGFFYEEVIAKNPIWKEIYEWELKLVPVTARLEENGIMVNRQKCKDLINELRDGVEVALNDLEALIGERLNPYKARDVQWLLYKKLGFPVLKSTKKTSVPSVDKETLAELRRINPHPALDLIVKYKSWDRGVEILSSYLELADDEGILHPNINTCGAITGRESSSKPNLQNVAKEKVLLNPFPVPARRCFRPRLGCLNFHIDYSGIEMRLLVHYSEEDKLLKIIKEGGDVHEPAALVFFRDKYRNAQGKEKKMLRDASKNMNFAIPYGGGAQAVATGLGFSLPEGAARFADYKKAFPKLVKLNSDIAKQVRQLGYITTTFGRRLYIPRDLAYMGLNYLIQGTAAEILKRAQVRVDAILRKDTGYQVKLLLPIHDEIILQWPRESLKEAPYLMRKIRDVMIDFNIFKVPLEVEMEYTVLSWAEKKPWEGWK
jgi:DNA polymerase-1